MPGSFTLSLQAADVLGEDLRVSLRQFPFEIPYSGATVHERSRVRTDVWADLRCRGLADSDGVDPDVDQALKLLHAPGVVVAVTAVEVATEAVFRARVAVSGRAGIRAVQDEQRVRFEFVDTRGLARTCTDLLPDVPTGRLESATISTAPDTQQSRREADDNGSGNAGSWLAAAQATASNQAGGARMRKAQRIMALPVQRVGYFFVTGRDGAGKPVRLPALGWRDTAQGRYSVTTRRSNDGADWNTFAGAGKADLARYLDEHLGRLQPR